MKAKKTKFHGIYEINGKLATVNLVPGYQSANEELVEIGGKEFRIWDHFTSKPAAAIKRNISIFPIKKAQKVLYLGFASGKTGSFISDIVGREGMVYAVEISERSLREALPMTEKRGNIVCILNDARLPEKYENMVIEKVDVIFSDTADPQQVEIVIRNTQKFLKPSGHVMLSIKSQSISSTKPPKEIYKECLKKLEKYFEILDKVELDPYERAHMLVIMKSK